MIVTTPSHVGPCVLLRATRTSYVEFIRYNYVVMAALCNRCGHYILPCDFYLLPFFLLFSSHNLSDRRLDVCHTSTHGVALVRIQNAGLKYAACSSLEMQQIAKNLPSGHYRTTLSDHIFATKARIDNRKQTC